MVRKPEYGHHIDKACSVAELGTALPGNRAKPGPCLVETMHVFLLDASYLYESLASLMPLQQPSAARRHLVLVCPCKLNVY